MTAPLVTAPARELVPRLLALVAPAHEDEEVAWLTAARHSKLDAVVVRDRNRGDLDRLTRLERFVHAGQRTLTSGRCDLARAVGCAGVHLPSDGIPVAAARSLLAPAALIGCSTHTLDDIQRAHDAGASYVVFGPVWPTPGKGPAIGLGQLAQACRLGIAVLALGGVTVDRFLACSEAGAAGVAGIRLVADPRTLEFTVAAAAAAFTRPSGYHPAP